jgi:hypothetical protein
MCVGSILRLDETWDDDGVLAGRFDDGTILPLLFVPEAVPGDYLLVHLGVAVEVLEPDEARDAIALRAEGVMR